MEDEELKPTSGDSSQDDSNQEDGDGSEDLDLSFLDSDDGDDGKSKEDREAELLSNLNKLTGKDFKTIQAAAKSLKEADKAFSNKGREKAEDKKVEPKTVEPKAPSSMDKIVTKLYFDANPEASLVWDKVKKVSSQMGREPIEVYEDDDFSFFKAEAKALYEEQSEDEDNKGKIKSPSSPSRGKGTSSAGPKLNDAERALLARYGKTAKDVKSED